MKIKAITAYEILASGGYPSIECKVELESGAVGIASVPYGASAGSHEANVLNDADAARYAGKGMLKAVTNIQQKIAPALMGKDASEQRAIDQIMIDLDGTENKSHLGGNAILAVSLSVAKAMAQSKGQELYAYIRDYYQTGVDFSTLPQPMVVAIEGGKHAHHSTDLQEFCISAIASNSVTENIRKVLETYHVLEKILQENNLSTNVGNEGAFAPSGIISNETPLEFIVQAIKKAGYVPGQDLAISLDAAASEFYDAAAGKYNLKLENKILNSGELSNYYQGWLGKYPIITMEDMQAEDDWAAWTEFKKICDAKNILLIGDDLTVTNVKRLQMAIDQQAISAILIKLNQIGTLTETIDCCLLAKKHGLATITSHRGGGETNDTSMIDVAVAVGSRFVKVGPTRGERVAKYNRLMEIERQLA